MIYLIIDYLEKTSLFIPISYWFAVKTLCKIIAYRGRFNLKNYTADANLSRADDKDSTRWLPGLEKAQELEHAGERTRVISVCDREGDLWKLLGHAHQTAQELLVRSAKKSARQVVTAAGGRADLWASVLATKPMGERTIRFPASGGPHRRKERQA